MVTTTNDKPVGELYAAAEEVETLKTTLDTFMKEQATINNTISSSLEKLLKLAEDSGAKLPDSTPEDKSSSVKGKDTNLSYKIPQHRGPDYNKGDHNMHRKVNFASASSTVAHK
jgi:hypothetical protein